MKIKYLLSVVIGIFLMANLIYAAGTKPGTIALTNGVGTTDPAHDTVWITGGLTNAGNFETVINGDTVTTGNNVGHGARVNPNTVYVLAAGSLYLEQAGLTVTDSLGTVTIIGLPSGPGFQKPVLLHNEFNSVVVTSSQINGSLTLKNIQYEAEDLQGAYSANGEGDFFISGSNVSVDIENGLFEFDNIALINAQSVPQGLKAYYRGNYFRDFLNGTQWWGGRPFYAKVPIDTLIMTNNTFTLAGLLSLQQNSLTKYAFIDHNTIIDNLKYPFLNPIYLTCFFTNNLVVNSNMGGDDSINIIRGKGQDPDGLRDGVIGMDTINTRLVSAIQNEYKVYANKADTGTWTIVPSITLSSLSLYAASNVLTKDTNIIWDNYWTGKNPADGTGAHAVDSAASYLTWAISPAGPYGLINYPEVFINSRGYALAADHHGIVISTVNKNSIYEYPTQKLGFKTAALDTAQINWWIQFNRANYSVPNVTAPPFSSRITFGDGDPTTIPGPGGKEISYLTATGGITAFTDLKENFNQTVAVSTLDNLPVGSLIWGSTAYNEKNEMATALTAWTTESKNTAINEAAGEAKVTVNTYPNPFSSTATIEYSLPRATHVTLTILNLQGKVISTLVNENQEGSRSVQLSAEGLSQGVYIYVLKTTEGVVTGKLLLQGGM